MPLAPGTRLGAYELLMLVGTGGMGEVYRARDAKLNRDVAIKVLPSEVAADPERIARFEREARTLAALNHPNIGAIFGFEDAGGVPALVLELVDGPTLADRIAGKPLPPDEAIAIARQIAGALEAAHDQGVVHRDLKPANIKVRDDGTVKILDFGLAKVLEAPGGSQSNVTASPTLTSPALMTREGMILGTAAYMAPEQAKGHIADKRSDIWAFGCVFYEMLTGNRAFPGTEVVDTLAGVLRGEPDWNALPADVPLAVRTLVMRCLEKDRSLRIHDISTARYVLNEPASVAATAPGPMRLTPRTRRATLAASGSIILAGAVGVIVGAAIVAFLRSPRSDSIRSHVARFELPTSPSDPFTTTAIGANVAISPDGSRIVYTGIRNGRPELVLRRLDRLGATVIPGTDGATDPFFSYDGRQIGFRVEGDLKRMSVDGGRSVTICTAQTFEGAVWGADNVIVFGDSFALFRVAADGGQPEKIAAPDERRNEAGYARPVLLPGGSVVLYTVILRNGQTRVDARPLRGGEPTTVVEGGFGADYLPAGFLVYAQDDRLMATRFDAASRRVSGSPIVVEENVFTRTADGLSNAVVASDGTLAFVSGTNAGSLGRPIWEDARGVRVASVVDRPLEEPRNLRLSPDGKRLALTIGPPGQGQLWVYDLAGSAAPLKLTFQDHNTFPVWSPDARRIAFMSVAGSTFRVLSIPSDGSAVNADVLLTANAASLPLDWSPDAASLLLRSVRGNAFALLHLSDRTTRPWLEPPFAVYGARFSPDGRWAAYSSTQSGAAEVWVRPFPGPGAPIRVSLAGGHDPVWSRDGMKLFYTNGPAMLSAEITGSGSTLQVGRPQTLFEGGFAYSVDDLVLRYYDVAADGRFLMIEPTERKPASVVVAQHWDEELQSLLPR